MKKSILWLFCCILMTAWATTALPLALSAGGKPQTVCPVMGGPVDKNVYLDHQGKRIYFCCPACVPVFKKDPVKYLKKDGS